MLRAQFYFNVLRVTLDTALRTLCHGRIVLIARSKTDESRQYGTVRGLISASPLGISQHAPNSISCSSQN